MSIGSPATTRAASSGSIPGSPPPAGMPRTSRFSWHAALHELALDHTDAVIVRYRSQLAPPSVWGTRAMVNQRVAPVAAGHRGGNLAARRAVTGWGLPGRAEDPEAPRSPACTRAWSGRGPEVPAVAAAWIDLPMKL